MNVKMSTQKQGDMIFKICKNNLMIFNLYLITLLTNQRNKKNVMSLSADKLFIAVKNSPRNVRK